MMTIIWTKYEWNAKNIPRKEMQILKNLGYMFLSNDIVMNESFKEVSVAREHLRKETIFKE
jgi:hypothetical protein